MFIKEAKSNYGDTYKYVTLTGWIVVPLAVIALILVLLSIHTLSPGQAAVVTRFGQLEGVRKEGIYLALFEDMITYNVKASNVNMEHETGSSDGQYIFVDTAFTYTLASDKLAELYSKVGTQTDLEDKFIKPVIRDVVYQVAAQYATDSILPKQSEFRGKIFDEVKKRVNQEYLQIVDLQIIDIDFTPQYNEVLEQKQIAEQNAIKDRQVAEQNLEKKKVELESTKIEAQRQELLIQSLTKELLQKMWIEKWNGILPTTISGDADFLLPIK